MTSSPTPEYADFRVADLPTRRDTRFTLEPDAAARAALAQTLGLSALRKLRFSGVIKPAGRRGWRLEADLGATVVQPCVVTLAPVTTRIDTGVLRRFEPLDDSFEEGGETEMPEDDTLEALGEVISPAAIMAEALALAVPDYPRATDAPAGNLQHAAPGVAPLQDADLRPFAGLAALRDKLGSSDEDKT